MSPSKATFKRFLAFALAGAALFTLAGAGPAGAQVLHVPGDAPGVPAYARVERMYIPHTAEWAAIVFFRDPACVPAGFNLLDLFDIPGAFSCPLTVSGFEVWDDPATDAGPRQALSRGTAVPVWFVSWPALQAAIADDVLTMSELESLAPMKGVAAIFLEDLHPIVPGTSGGGNQPHLTIVASGLLPDGRSFQYELTALPHKIPTHIRIVFR